MSRRLIALLSLAYAVIVVLLWPSPAEANRRIALIIGNSNYQHAGQLANPANDAAAIATLLRSSGFANVEVRRDLGMTEMRRALGDFSEAARNADMALFFYAGHGIEVDGTNYLLPVDARLIRDFDVEDEAISLDRVLRAIEPAKRLRFVMLDACRDNPFVRTMRRASRSVGRGLARVEPASDTLVAFATEAGTIAADGDQATSPFTGALLRHLATPGLDLRIAFGRVRDEVMGLTGNRQRPFIYGSLGGSTVAIVDAPPPSAPIAVPVPQAVAPDQCAAAEAHWRSAEAIGSRAAYEDHILRFGGCVFAGLANARISAIDREARERAEAEEQRKQAEMAAQQLEREALEARRRAEDEARRRAEADQQRRKAEADEARRRAEAADAERRRIAALPPPPVQAAKEGTARSGGFDGVWTVRRSVAPGCGARSAVFTIRVRGSEVRGPGGFGSISPSGTFRVAGRANAFTGTLRGNSGSGTYSGKCSGTFTASKN